MTGGLATRRLEGEILDRLPPHDPRALASRRDLRRINAVMMQAGVMARLLRANVRTPPRRILEIGGGDGRFMLAVARRLARRWPGVELRLLDLSDTVTPGTRQAFAALGWTLTVETGDVFAWARGTDRTFDAVAANLVLHHFDDRALGALFRALAPRTVVFVAAEPRRTAFALAASRMVWALGANGVTRHDAPASVRAGFRGGELSALWPPGWTVEEGPRGLFTHAFAAILEDAA